MNNQSNTKQYVQIVCAVVALVLLVNIQVSHPKIIHADQSSTLSRPNDPVVMQGSDIPSFQGVTPNELVAFRFINSSWQQIPVQVDEKDFKDYGVIYHDNPIGYSKLVYTDPNTYTGSDSNPNIDNNDEIVFMGKDVGDKPSTFSEPQGIVSGSGIEVTVSDPLVPGQIGFVYLFRQSSGLNPSAGQQYINYTFSLNSGNYKTTYGFNKGTNPENSSVVTPYYRAHFADRWIEDQLNIKVASSTQVDVLDRHKFQFSPTSCVRTDDVFAQGEGAFITNKNGPVRAIRSYMGAQSGPFSQRDHIMYERRQDEITYARVHEIAGAMDFFDYSPSAAGMTYSNNNNLSGVLVNGIQDSVTAGPLSWEMIKGQQGGLVMAHKADTNLVLSPTSYYLDDTKPSDPQCSGDAYAYGSSGTWVNQTIACTDDYNYCPGTTTRFVTTRTIYYESPDVTVADAQQRQLQATNPLTFTTTPWQGQLPPDTTAPVINVTSPVDGASVQGTISVTASASDNAAVAGVQFKLDGNSLGVEDTTAPYSVSWNTTSSANGSHTLTATARDTSNNIATSTPVTITVNNPAIDTTPPTTTITSPANNSTVARKANITITATASDNVGVTKVEFYINGSLKCTDTTTPYSCVWQTPNGKSTNQIQTKAYDAASNIGSSATVKVSS